MRVLGVVPARGGSVRVPRKNLMRVAGEPLVVGAARACQDAVELEEYVVSTDDPEIAAVAHEQTGIRVLKRRCGADGPMAAVLLEAADCEDGDKYDAVACVQPTSPLRTAEDIDNCVRLLRDRAEAESVVSVDEATGGRNGAVYVVRLGMLLRGLVFDEQSLHYPMPSERSLDVNTPADLERARELTCET